MQVVPISIHAPSRERQKRLKRFSAVVQFQSTLPRGSDLQTLAPSGSIKYFNPRSLAGATLSGWQLMQAFLFQSTLPRGSDRWSADELATAAISIHAPSRERLSPTTNLSTFASIFQSTLPRGSDNTARKRPCCNSHFNPRSLAGATSSSSVQTRMSSISIHAPSRERPSISSRHANILSFQSTLPRGSDPLVR